MQERKQEAGHSSAGPEKASEHWDQRFSVEEYVFGEQPNAYLASKRSLYAQGGRALCVADGEGRNSVWLAECGLAVDAFDYSAPAVRKAEALAAKRNVRVGFRLADLFGWTWSEAAYDLVAAIFIQFATPAQREQLFPLMARALKPGGILILQGYRPEQLNYRTGGPSDPTHLYTEEMLRPLLSDLEVLELLSYDQALNEGKGHHGMSALIGAVARKPRG